MATKQEIKIDPKNARIHNDRNSDLINRSLKLLGAGRSIVIDAEGYVIGGNETLKQARELGIKEKIVESDGTELIVVQRTDLKHGDKKRKELAIIDNAATDSSSFNEEVFEDEYFEEVDISEWRSDENVSMSDIETGDAFQLPDGDKAPFQQMTFTLADEQAEIIKNAISDVKQTEDYKYCETMGNENSNGNALYLIIAQ